MKKLITALLSVLLVSSFFTATNVCYGEGAGDNPKVDALVLSAFLGEPITINSLMDGSIEHLNDRHITIHPNDKKIIAMIRVSESEMYVWQLELNPENILMAELLLDEKAPMCIVACYEGDAATDYAIYIKSDAAGSSYKSFMNEVDRITKSLSAGNISTRSDTEDPILSCFSGLSWNMTRDNLLKSIDNDRFTKMDYESEDTLAGSIIIRDKAVTLLFGLKNNKLSTVWALIDENEGDAYLNIFKEVYGDPHKTTYANAFMGKVMAIKDDPNGDCYAWKTDKTLIIMQNSRIEYAPLY